MTIIVFENCIRCGLPQDAPKHDPRHPDTSKHGWHVFRGQDYLDGLEDALLYLRENATQQHQWEDSGIVIDTAEPFLEKYCTICGTKNWGGKEDGVCFGSQYAEMGINAAHNRRAGKLTLERILKK